MARKYPDLIGDLAIIQGETYRQLTHTLPGDKTTWTARGQIRTTLLADDAGDPLCEFEWDTPVYDALADETTFYPYLSDETTTNLPRTKYQGNAADLRVKKAYVYDLEFESPTGEVEKLAPGFVQAIGEVTDNSIIWNPPIFWNGSIDHISLTSTTGLTDTYTVWGDAAETINLGTFEVKNAEGVGIESATYNASTGILTFVYTDSTTFQTGDIRGEKGEKGDKGDPGDSANLTDAEIKIRYENNPDTNAFTDAEKTKLAGIADGAEVNVNADWNATSGDAQILNKPTLGTAAATNSTDYATSVQGAKADTAVQPAAIANFETTTQLNNRDTANRDRTNHTGSQAISTVSGLQTALDLKAPLANPTFIGTALTLPNNSRINGFEHFYQATRPTSRGNGSALIIGDRWWKTNTRDEWFWNGTYWLSSTRYWAGFSGDQLFNATTGMRLTPILADHSNGVQPYFLENLHCYYNKQQNNEYFYTATDYWSFYLSLLATDRDASSLIVMPSSPVITNPRVSVTPYSPNSADTINYSINTAFGVSGNSSINSFAYLRLAEAVLLKTGSPAPLEGVYPRLNYRYIQL